MNSESVRKSAGLPALRGGEVCVRARKARAPALARRRGSVRACAKSAGACPCAAGSVRVQARMVDCWSEKVECAKSTMGGVVADE